MTPYTAFEYLLIDIANQYGLDKLIFEERLTWSKKFFNDLENMVDTAENPPLYQKAVMALRKVQRGEATGHMVGLDATCSGIQVMSVLTGCEVGANATGLVDPDRRADAYTQTIEEMNRILGGGVPVDRADAKHAMVASFYGSKKTPKEVFGDDTPELNAFYQAAQRVAPGAWDLLQVLLDSWQPYALLHEWKLPDGYDARVKVMEKVSARIEVDELAHASFTYEFYDNIGTRKGLSNVANLVHSVDAYILRSMHRRCNYDQTMVEDAARLIEIELLERHLNGESLAVEKDDDVAYYVEQYKRSSLADVVILPYLDSDNIRQLSTQHLQSLSGIVHGMLQYRPFDLVTVHDEFRAHPNHLNHVRYQYKEIMAEIAESYLLDDLLSQIHGMPCHFPKLSVDLNTKIRKSNYGLC